MISGSFSYPALRFAIAGRPPVGACPPHERAEADARFGVTSHEMGVDGQRGVSCRPPDPPIRASPGSAPAALRARPVDSEIVAARAPWSTKCSVVTNVTAGGRGSMLASPILDCGSLWLTATLLA
jgi:hypothetical protein